MKKLNTKELDPLINGKTTAQIIKKICGEKLGSGAYRNVYVLKQNPNFVVKVENVYPFRGNFINICEWRNYINNRDWKFLAEWLAPCELISQSGEVLIQRRVDQSRPKKDFPKHIPAIFTDTKYANFGFLGDQCVCCDYAFFPVYFIKPGGKMYKRAKWWDHTLQIRKIKYQKRIRKP